MIKVMRVLFYYYGDGEYYDCDDDVVDDYVDDDYDYDDEDYDDDVDDDDDGGCW